MRLKKRPVDEMSWHLNCHSRQPDFDSLELQGVEALHEDVQLGTCWKELVLNFAQAVKTENGQLHQRQNVDFVNSMIKNTDKSNLLQALEQGKSRRESERE